jgi:hypothetical protein
VHRVRHRRANHWLITTEDAFREKLMRVRIDVELEVAVQKASLDATTRVVGSVIDINHANHAAHGNARTQSQRDRHDHAEESVSTNGEREEFGIVAATARHCPHPVWQRRARTISCASGMLYLTNFGVTPCTKSNSKHAFRVPLNS